MLKSVLKKQLSQDSRQRLLKMHRRLTYYKEYLLWGSERREARLVKLLERHYASVFRRQWQLGDEEPHFFSQRLGLFEFGFGRSGHGPYPFYRGFYSSEILRDGDRLLDIGCGDGFFTRRFFSERCSAIDGVDIEPTAISSARAHNSAPNVTYHLLDAVNQPFPASEYDVIVWDGALGHFSADTTDLMLGKIRQHLADDGIFVGSESLGVEGTDHLQFFHTLEDLYAIFKPHFKHVELREVDYYIGRDERTLRREGYWRCSNDLRRLQDSHWQVYSSVNEDAATELSYAPNESS